MTGGETAYETAYTFIKGADAYGGNATTPLIASIRQGEGGSAMNFDYEYDSRGNITSETRNGKVTTYTYDALGQLIRVNDPNDPTAGGKRNDMALYLRPRREHTFQVVLQLHHGNAGGGA